VNLFFSNQPQDKWEKLLRASTNNKLYPSQVQTIVQELDSSPENEEKGNCSGMKFMTYTACSLDIC
jgi:hypothetical protein